MPTQEYWKNKDIISILLSKVKERGGKNIRRWKNGIKKEEPPRSIMYRHTDRNTYWVPSLLSTVLNHDKTSFRFFLKVKNRRV